ncbi:MAG: hypothetical protein NTU47_13575 [Ignavibacteriales bacterium]|nr:hypothetical protein [Ignavibacteriales bacterium]
MFDLAEVVYAFILDKKIGAHKKQEKVRRKKKLTEKILRFFRYYGEGAVTAMPMIGQIVCILVLRYSLWAWVDFTEAQATIVALGTLLSFIVTGGFIQSIGREGIRLVGSENYFLAEKICWKLVAQGTFTVLGVAIAIFLANLVIPLYDTRLTLVSLMYYVLLSEIWLYSSVAVVLSRPMSVLAVTLAGVVPVYCIMEYTSLGIYLAHWSGMGFALILIMLYTMIVFRRTAESTIPELKSGRLPKPSVRAYLIAPYFVYGVFYFLNIFIDRFVSWSAPSPEPPPYMFWFRTSYELGLDWALISLVFTLALLEYIIHEFSHFQIPAQKAVKCVRVEDYIGFFRRFYRKFLFLVAVVAVIDILVTYFGVMYFRQFSEIKEVREFFSSPTTYLVFYAASVGYLLIAIGLYNGLFFFTLSRPEFVLRSIIPATAVNLLVALIASRCIHYEYGVLGLVAGGATFAVLSTRYAQEFFRNLDYYYYAAY